MSEAITVDIVTPISSVNMIGGGEVCEEVDEVSLLKRELEDEREKLVSSIGALSQASSCFQQAQDELFGEHREQIASLSVKIAEKILLKEIGSGNYDIQKIISEALKKSPSKQNIEVQLNEVDFNTVTNALKDKANDFECKFEMSVDANIGHGECIVKTDKGIIEHLIESHLNQIAEALKQTE